MYRDLQGPKLVHRNCLNHTPWVVLGDISIFWEYRDISLDNISYRAYSWISKYRIKDEVYSLDMYSRIIP